VKGGSDAVRAAFVFGSALQPGEGLLWILAGDLSGDAVHRGVFERAFRDGFDPVGGLGWVAGLELGANDGVHHLMSALVARFVSLEDKLGGEVGVGINEA